MNRAAKKHLKRVFTIRKSGVNYLIIFPIVITQNSLYSSHI